MKWRSSGSDTCPPSCYENGNYCQSDACQKEKCVSSSVRCLGGTGDFRIALLDTSHTTGKVAGDNWCPTGRGYGNMTKCVESHPFDKMRGYDFRIFPHLSKTAKHEPGQVPCSIYKKESTNLFGKARLGEWGCFATPLGEWTEFSLAVIRLDSRRAEIRMTMNGITYKAEDESPDDVGQIDAIAIGYPNERRYSYVDMGYTT
eukprot:m.245196 g.245196  ORF g.245196 m.245196 type:complete len:202 (+) comp16107_c0_seq5:446-1051(+)